MAKALKTASLVVSRAGMGFLTELAYLGKPTILIPIPDSHQIENASAFSEMGAAILLEQRGLSAEKFYWIILDTLDDKEKRSELAFNMRRVLKKNGNGMIIEEIKKLIS
jgi:UDP-N-acetylglucosamine--N-acetylmuramyl-(pentapeptide) pyrophosphoryl-undecaprenol N-acetylglucosamine transferase